MTTQRGALQEQSVKPYWIHEQGFLVVGVGRRDTPKAFVNSCGVFVYVDNLTPAGKTAAEPAQRTEPADDDWTETAAAAVAAACEDDGWAQLGQVGTLLRQRDPGFDPRSYGMVGRRLSLLIKSRPDLFELSGDSECGGPIRVRLAGGRA